MQNAYCVICACSLFINAEASPVKFSHRGSPSPSPSSSSSPFITHCFISQKTLIIHSQPSRWAQPKSATCQVPHTLLPPHQAPVLYIYPCLLWSPLRHMFWLESYSLWYPTAVRNVISVQIVFPKWEKLGVSHTMREAAEVVCLHRAVRENSSAASTGQPML